MTIGNTELKILLKETWDYTAVIEQKIADIRSNIINIATQAGILKNGTPEPNEKLKLQIECPRCERT